MNTFIYQLMLRSPCLRRGRLLCSVCGLLPIPAKERHPVPRHGAGIQPSTLASNGHFWMPAFAGMTLGSQAPSGRKSRPPRVRGGRGCVTSLTKCNAS